MTDSILDSVKETLGIAADYDVFDQELMLHINSVVSNLTQLGVGPDSGFIVTGQNITWEDFMGNEPRLNMVKSYLSAKVKMLFDPPTVGFVISSMEKILQEYEWRIREVAEQIKREAIVIVIPVE